MGGPSLLCSCPLQGDDACDLSVEGLEYETFQDFERAANASSTPEAPSASLPAKENMDGAELVSAAAIEVKDSAANADSTSAAPAASPPAPLPGQESMHAAEVAGATAMEVKESSSRPPSPAGADSLRPAPLGDGHITTAGVPPIAPASATAGAPHVPASKPAAGAPQACAGSQGDGLCPSPA